MIERIEVLRRLQLLRNKIGELEEFKEYRKKEIKEKNNQIESKRALSVQKHEEMLSAQKEIGRKELDLKTDEEQINKFNVQLNTIKTNKEYSALRSEIGCKEADKSLLEDEILNMMSRLEIISKEYKKLTEELKYDEEKLSEFIKSADEDTKKTDEEIEKLQNDQEKYSNLLDEDTLYHYKRLSNKKGGKAIVEVADNVCGGCFMNITLQTLNSLIGGKELVLCPNCRRILFLNEEYQFRSR
ncbi:MAG: zinc ribbon domain-containing protein [Candidatus Scalinduaceae bacterium]